MLRSSAAAKALPDLYYLLAGCPEAVQKERIMAGQTFTEGIPM
jgi:hypothetical protein